MTNKTGLVTIWLPNGMAVYYGSTHRDATLIVHDIAYDGQDCIEVQYNESCSAVNAGGEVTTNIVKKVFYSKNIIWSVEP